jgi:hypothetical protein
MKEAILYLPTKSVIRFFVSCDNLIFVACMFSGGRPMKLKYSPSSNSL